jgi:hypothetical protein
VRVEEDLLQLAVSVLLLQWALGAQKQLAALLKVWVVSVLLWAPWQALEQVGLSAWLCFSSRVVLLVLLVLLVLVLVLDVPPGSAAAAAAVVLAGL